MKRKRKKIILLVLVFLAIIMIPVSLKIIKRYNLSKNIKKELIIDVGSEVTIDNFLYNYNPSAYTDTDLSFFKTLGEYNINIIIDNEKFIKPVKGARKEKIDLVKYIDNEMLDILNIGKKVYFKEKINDREILDYADKYGMFGLILEQILEDTKPNSKFDVRGMTIFSKEYVESFELIRLYAGKLYEFLYNIDKKSDRIRVPAILTDRNTEINFVFNIENDVTVKVISLKQAIDLYFTLQISKPVRTLKICKYCNKAFFANNIKANYCCHSCKNKANVYKCRAKARNGGVE